MRGERRSVVVSVARWSARHRWWAILIWVTLVVGAVLLGGAAGTVRLESADEGNGESARVERALAGSDLREPLTEYALVRRAGGGRAGAEAMAAGRALAAAMAGGPGVDEVSPPVRSADGTAVVVRWTVAPPGEGALDAMRERVAAVAAANPGLRIGQVGPLSVERALEDAVGDDLGRAERLSLPITLLILLVAFGALVAAAVPVLLALTCVAMAIGMTAVASHAAPVTDAVNSVILLIGLAVGVDYSMFFMRRVRDERARGVATLDAVDIAAATAGRAVVVSGVTVMIAMAGMFLSGNTIFSSFAIGTIVVVAAAIVGSLTVLPAVVALLGDRIDRPRVPFLHRLTGPGRHRLWRAVLGPVLRRPAVALVLGAGVLVALAVPAAQLNPRLLGTEDIPRSLEVMRTYDALVDAFPSDGEAHVVVIRAQDVTAPAVRSAIDDLWRRAGAREDFALSSAPRVDVSGDRRVARVALPYPGADGGSAAESGLTALRETLVPETVGRVADAGVTGNPALNRDFTGQLSARLPWVFAFVLTLTFALMVMSFRSLPVAALTVALNLLSVAAAYGILVLVFQGTWAEGLLGFRSNGGIVAWLPLFLFVVLFGLSMDYHVFVLSRIREGVDAGLGHGAAIRWGVVSSAGVVTSAAVVMVAVFAVFATLSTPDFKQLGVGLSSAVLIDATLVRGVLLPAALRLMGPRAWYLPSWLEWVPRLGGERVPAAAGAVAG